MKARSKFAEGCIVRSPIFDDGIIAVEPCIDPEGRGYTSPMSPTNLRYARSHADLAGRGSPPLSAGLSMKERLETRDDWNWD